MPRLSQYIDQVTDLLHDQRFMFSSQRSITRAINEARRQCALRTGCVKRIITGQSAFGAGAQPGYAIPSAMQPNSLPEAIPANSLGATLNGVTVGPPSVTGAAVGWCQTIPGVERYPYIGFFNEFLKQQHAGCESVVDTVSLAVNWGGAVRPALAWLPWQDLQAYARAYATLVTSYPYYWAVMNDGEMGEIWMFPAPSVIGDIEMEAMCIPSPLYTDDDYDVIPEGFANAIQYGAAAHIFKNSRRHTSALLLENDFNERLGVGSVSRDRGKTPNMYYGSF